MDTNVEERRKVHEDIYNYAKSKGITVNEAERRIAKAVTSNMQLKNPKQSLLSEAPSYLNRKERRKWERKHK
jgi:hypothetical protein